MCIIMLITLLSEPLQPIYPVKPIEVFSQRLIKNYNEAPTRSRLPPIHNELGLHGCPGNLRTLAGQHDLAGVHRKWLSLAVAQQGGELQRSVRPVQVYVVISCKDGTFQWVSGWVGESLGECVGVRVSEWAVSK